MQSPGTVRHGHDEQRLRGAAGHTQGRACRHRRQGRASSWPSSRLTQACLGSLGGYVPSVTKAELTRLAVAMAAAAAAVAANEIGGAPPRRTGREPRWEASCLSLPGACFCSLHINIKSSA